MTARPQSPTNKSIAIARKPRPHRRGFPFSRVVMSRSIRVALTAADRRRGGGSRRPVAQHRLHLEELLEAEDAPFAAVARLLEAAEGRGEVGAGAVQMHLAGAELRRDAAGVIDVARLDVSRKPVDGVVRHGERLLLALIG